jgi:anti-sigma B factor antagonist
MKKGMTSERGRTMSQYPSIDGRNHVRIATGSSSSDDSRRDPSDISEAAGRPSLRVRIVERTVAVRFEDAEILFEEGAVHTVRRELHRLVEEEGHTRLVLDFAGVRYHSSEVLGILAGLQRRVDPVRGSIVLCGLDPLLRDMVRITHLDRVFDVYGDEAEALRLKAVDEADAVGT